MAASELQPSFHRCSIPTLRRSYSGYVDIEAKHLFFYFFESRSDPDVDPVLMWINGGPGCSSSLGAFMELGPCNIHDGNGPKYNPYAWNTKANLFLLDEPIGVGFSYANHGETVFTTEDAAIDVAAFVSIFFETFSRFQGRGFHLSGESYGGRYLPVFASAVYDSNAVAIAEGRVPINLQSVIIGNGISDFVTMTYSYYDMTCTKASVDPILPISTCVRMKQALPRCKAWLEDSCVNKFDSIACGAASNFCATELSAPFRTSSMFTILFVSCSVDLVYSQEPLRHQPRLRGQHFGDALLSAHQAHQHMARPAGHSRQARRCRPHR